MSTGALERAIRRAGARQGAARERCELCSGSVDAGHRHLLDTDTGEPLCCCQACSLLFARPAASEGHYRLIPQRRVRLPMVDPAALGVPVGLAFFVLRSDGSLLAHYPSPAGATQWEVDGVAWQRARQSTPALAELAPEVEALLVDTTPEHQEAWLVPVSDCFRLVALVRREWRGLTGGDRVRPAIEEFFEEIRRGDGQDPRG